MKGRKTGGRKKGSVNKANRVREAAIAAQGITPMDFLLEIVRNKRRKLALRLDAAKAVAPYVHPKLNNVTVSTPPGKPLVMTYTPAEPALLQDYYAKLAASASAADLDPRAARDLGSNGRERDESQYDPDAGPR